MLVHQPLAGQEPEPEEERHRGVLVVFRQPPGRVEARLLDDVGRVDPPLQPPVEAQGDHATQPLAVPAQQLPQSPLVPAHGLLDQPRRLAPSGTLAMDATISLYPDGPQVWGQETQRIDAKSHWTNCPSLALQTC